MMAAPVKQFLFSRRVITCYLLLLAVGLAGCTYVKQHWVCWAIPGCIESHFSPAPNVVLPASPSDHVDLFYSRSEIRWPYQELGTITVYSSKEKNGQDMVEQARSMAQRFGGDGLLLPETMKGCEFSSGPYDDCGLQIPMHAILVHRSQN